MRHNTIFFAALLMHAHLTLAQVPAGLTYSGKTSWIPLAPLCLRLPSCSLTLIVADAEIDGLPWRARNSRGRIVVNRELPGV